MSRDSVIDDIVDRAHEYVMAIDDAIEKQFEGEGPSRLSDEEFAVAINQKLQQFPPAPIMFPDGSVRTVSPFIVALMECEGGRPYLNRIRKLFPGGM